MGKVRIDTVVHPQNLVQSLSPMSK